jgi:hypothetical protein
MKLGVCSVCYCCPNLTKTLTCRQSLVEFSSSKFRKNLFSNLRFVIREQTCRHAESLCCTFADDLYEGTKYVLWCEALVSVISTSSVRNIFVCSEYLRNATTGRLHFVSLRVAVVLLSPSSRIRVRTSDLLCRV